MRSGTGCHTDITIPENDDGILTFFNYFYTRLARFTRALPEFKKKKNYFYKM